MSANRGSGAPMLLVGDHPSRTTLPDGNLVHHTDFRRVYATVLEEWLGLEAKPVVGDGLKPLDVFKKA